jgi:hypothetical protein
VSEVRVAGAGAAEGRLAVTQGTFRGWIREKGGLLVIEEGSRDLPQW